LVLFVDCFGIYACGLMAPTFKRTYELLGLKDGEGQRPVEANSTGGQGSRRAVAPSDDDDDDDDDDDLMTPRQLSRPVIKFNMPWCVYL
jgi:hypothetical protein